VGWDSVNPGFSLRQWVQGLTKSLVRPEKWAQFTCVDFITITANNRSWSGSDRVIVLRRGFYFIVALSFPSSADYRYTHETAKGNPKTLSSLKLF
jgi:hypothetical protein